MSELHVIPELQNIGKAYDRYLNSRCGTSLHTLHAHDYAKLGELVSAVNPENRQRRKDMKNVCWLARYNQSVAWLTEVSQHPKALPEEPSDACKQQIWSRWAEACSNTKSVSFRKREERNM